MAEKTGVVGIDLSGARWDVKYRADGKPVAFPTDEAGQRQCVPGWPAMPPVR